MTKQTDNTYALLVRKNAKKLKKLGFSNDDIKDMQKPLKKFGKIFRSSSGRKDC